MRMLGWAVGGQIYSRAKLSPAATSAVMIYGSAVRKKRNNVPALGVRAGALVSGGRESTDGSYFSICAVSKIAWAISRIDLRVFIESC